MRQLRRVARRSTSPKVLIFSPPGFLSQDLYLIFWPSLLSREFYLTELSLSPSFLPLDIFFCLTKCSLTAPQPVFVILAVEFLFLALISFYLVFLALISVFLVYLALASFFLLCLALIDEVFFLGRLSQQELQGI